MPRDWTLVKVRLPEGSAVRIAAWDKETNARGADVVGQPGEVVQMPRFQAESLGLVDSIKESKLEAKVAVAEAKAEAKARLEEVEASATSPSKKGR